MSIVENTAAMKIYIEGLIIWCMCRLRFDKWASLGRIMHLWGAKKKANYTGSEPLIASGNTEPFV